MTAGHRMSAATRMTAPTATVSATATATAVLSERAGREQDGTQQAADQEGELVDGRTTLHNFTTLDRAKNLLRSRSTWKGTRHQF
jgi:hypothetical protein